MSYDIGDGYIPSASWYKKQIEQLELSIKECKDQPEIVKLLNELIDNYKFLEEAIREDGHP